MRPVFPCLGALVVLVVGAWSWSTCRITRSICWRLAEHPELAEAARRELAGKDLACWCDPDELCHADVLLEVANGEAAP